MEQRTALVFCDFDTPMLPCMVREEDFLRKRSLGSVFAAKTITKELVEANQCTLKGVERFSLYGMLKGEHHSFYPPLEVRQAEEYLSMLCAMFDVVLIDANSVLTGNRLSAAALRCADKCVRLYGCDFKTLSFYASSRTYLETLGIKDTPFYKVISDVTDEDRMRKMYQKPAFFLPHSNELTRQMFTGDVFRDLEFKESKAYLDGLTRLAEELIS